MTLSELSKLDNATLDRMAAEDVMGWRWEPYETFGGTRHCWMGQEGAFKTYHPTRDLNQCHELEEKVIEKVGDLAYVAALFKVTGFGDKASEFEGLVRAKAKQRVIACLLAVGGGE